MDICQIELNEIYNTSFVLVYIIHTRYAMICQKTNGQPVDILSVVCSRFWPGFNWLCSTYWILDIDKSGHLLSSNIIFFCLDWIRDSRYSNPYCQLQIVLEQLCNKAAVTIFRFSVRQRGNGSLTRDRKLRLPLLYRVITRVWWSLSNTGNYVHF